MDPDRYRISEQERADTYTEVFERFALGKQSLSFPRLILIGGQPGAGKSRIAQRARIELKAIGAPVMADIDDIRPLHPNIVDIFQNDPFKMSAITNMDAWGWTSHLLLDTRHARNNVVYQATIRHAKRIEDLIKEFQKEGFAVDMYAVAVHRRTSTLGIFKRFENDIAQMAINPSVIPRWVPIPFHNQVYDVFPSSVDYLAENARIERVGIFERDGTELYFSDRDLIHHGAGEAIIRERAREWSPDERAYFGKSWQELIERIEARPNTVLKPKWYLKQARLFASEADHFSQASHVYAQELPADATASLRTPSQVFVVGGSGELVGYDRPRRSPFSRIIPNAVPR